MHKRFFFNSVYISQKLPAFQNGLVAKHVFPFQTASDRNERIKGKRRKCFLFLFRISPAFPPLIGQLETPEKPSFYTQCMVREVSFYFSSLFSVCEEERKKKPKREKTSSLEYLLPFPSRFKKLNISGKRGKMGIYLYNNIKWVERRRKTAA